MTAILRGCRPPKPRREDFGRGLHLFDEAVRRVDDEETCRRETVLVGFRFAPDVDGDARDVLRTAGQHFAGERVRRGLRFDGMPDERDAGGETLACAGQRLGKLYEFVFRFKRRIDQDKSAPLRRRQQRSETRVAVRANRLRVLERRQCLRQRRFVFGMFLDRDELVVLDAEAGLRSKAIRDNARHRRRPRCRDKSQEQAATMRRRDRRAARCRRPPRPCAGLLRCRDRRRRGPHACR